MAEHVGDASKYIDYGMTSSDMLDTGLALQIKRAGELLQRDLVALGEVLKRRAFEFRDTVQVGRTHGIHAEPITFGMKLGMWAFEVERDLERLRRVTEGAAVGKLSGAVGAYNNIDPRVEELVCAELDLGYEPIANQVVQRDRHAAFLSALAIVGGSLEKFTLEVRHLQRTEVREVEEAFGKGQKGSSAMPHKRNPILSERMAGCARVLRGNALVGMENMALWHERDISHSSAERIVFPDSCILLDYMLQKTTRLFDTLVVDEERMRGNLALSQRLVFSGAVLLALVDHGMLRDDAYRVVQGCAMRAWSSGVDFGALIKGDPEAAAVLSVAEVDAAMDPDQYRAGREVIFGRLGQLTFRAARRRGGDGAAPFLGPGGNTGPAARPSSDQGEAMRAVRVHAFGEPDVLQVEEVADPRPPGAGEVLVRLHAAGVNPVDAYMRSGQYGALPSLPYTPGSDGAGVVEAVGEKRAGAPGPAVGDRVYTSGSLTGTYAERALCRVEQVHALPLAIGFAAGAALGVPYATAYRALFQRGQAGAGDLVLVHGASGGVGIATVQFALGAGLTVHGTAGSEDGRRLVAAQGAAAVVDHTAADSAAELLAADRRARLRRHRRDGGPREPGHRPGTAGARRAGGRGRQPRTGRDSAPRAHEPRRRRARHVAVRRLTRGARRGLRRRRRGPGGGACTPWSAASCRSTTRRLRTARSWPGRP